LIKTLLASTKPKDELLPWRFTFSSGSRNLVVSQMCTEISGLTCCLHRQGRHGDSRFLRNVGNEQQHCVMSQPGRAQSKSNYNMLFSYITEKPRHWSLSWASWTHCSRPLYLIFKLNLTLSPIHSSHTYAFQVVTSFQIWRFLISHMRAHASFHSLSFSLPFDYIALV
jgi:hypothetical protein